MDLEMSGNGVASSRLRGVIRSWTDREWAALPPGGRPEGVVRIGLLWVEMAPEGLASADPAGEGGTPSTPAAPRPSGSMAGARGRRLPAECVIVDPSSPGVREFLRRSTMEGLIRTVPAGSGRVLVLPTFLWSRGRPAPDAPE